MIRDSEIYITCFLRLERLAKEIEQERSPGEATIFWLPPISMVEKHPEKKANFAAPQPAAPALPAPEEDEAAEDISEEPPMEIPELPSASEVIAYGGFHNLAEYAAEFRASGVAANGGYSLDVWHVNALEYKHDPEMRQMYDMIQMVKQMREEARAAIMAPR